MMIIKHSAKVFFITEHQCLNVILIGISSTTSVPALKVLSHVSDQLMEALSL